MRKMMMPRAMRNVPSTLCLSVSWLMASSVKFTSDMMMTKATPALYDHTRRELLHLAHLRGLPD